MTTQVSIANRALTLIGANRILNLTDQTPEAQSVNNLWDDTLRSVLFEAPWGFALKRANPNRLAIEQAWGDWYSFELPNDLVRVVDVSPRSTRWRIEGNKLLCKEESVGILYVCMERTVSKYTPAFVDALTYKLAADICYELTNSEGKTSALLQLYKGEFLPMAKSKNAQDKTPEQVEDNFWIDSVYGARWD